MSSSEDFLTRSPVSPLYETGQCEAQVPLSPCGSRSSQGAITQLAADLCLQNSC